MSLLNPGYPEGRASVSPEQSEGRVVPVEKRSEERAEVQKRALWALGHAQELEPVGPVRRLQPELRVWHYPAFHPWVSWTVLREGRSSGGVARLWVREVSWDMPADMRRLSDPMEGLRCGFHTRPTLGVRDAELPAEQYQSLASAGSEVRIPIVTPDHAFGLDGETFGIETGDHFARFRCEWWGDGPQEWTDWVRWVAILRAFLRRCLEPEER
jgi:hypothetical protein